MIQDENSQMNKMAYGIKNMCFDLLYYIIDSDGYNIYIYILFVVIETFQCFYWYFYGYLKDLWKMNTLVDGFNNFFGFFMIVPYQSGDDQSSYDTLVYLMYVSLAFVTVTYIAILYVGYKLKNESNEMNGLKAIIKAILEISNPLLFFPLFDLFFMVFRCSPDDDGNYMHKDFKDIQCYKGNVLLHSFFGALGGIMTLGLSYLTLIGYFESRYRKNQVLIKVSGRKDVKLLVFKTLIVIASTFLDNDLIILVLIIMFLAQMVIFQDINKSSNYLNKYYCKLINIQSAILFWTTMMVVFAQIVYDTNYEGIPIVWLFGIPFIVIIVLLRKEYRYDLLMVDSNKFDSLNQAIFQILYLTQMLNYYTSDKNIRSILDAFVDYHRTICKRQDCPCVPKNMNQKKIKRFINNIGNRQEQEQVKDQFVVLVYIIERIFVLALTRFPACIQLRINHALFLLDKMKSTQQALQELALAEAEKPYIDEQFQIYRYKKLIEDQMVESRKNTNSNQASANEMSTDSHIKETLKNIEKSTQDHMEFWSQLSELLPDLGKLYEIGCKVNFSSLILSENWKKLEKMRIDNAPNLLRMYARYLLDVLHDVKQAQLVIKKLKAIDNHNVDRGKQTNNMNDFVNESIGLISISGEDSSLGRITGLNMTCSNLFGYSKSELLNRKVNILMHSIFSDQHDKIMEDYLHKLKSDLIGKDRMLMGKLKHGYILPFYINIRYVPSFISGTQFYAVTKVEKYFKVQCYLIVDSKSLEIISVTTNCISLFGITQSYIQKKNTKITDILPQFFANLNDYTQKGGYVQKIDFHVKESMKKSEFYKVEVQSISLRTRQIQGYIVKIEKSNKGPGSNPFDNDYDQSVLDDNNSYHNNDVNASQENHSVIDKMSVAQKQLFTHPAFIFQFDIQSFTFQGEYLIPVNFEKTSNENLETQNQHTNLPDTALEFYTQREEKIDKFLNLHHIQVEDKVDEQEKQRIEEEKEKNKIDYGAGIRIVIYDKGNFLDKDEVQVATISDEEQLEENDLYNFSHMNEVQQEQQQYMQMDLNDKTDVLKSREKFIYFLQHAETQYSKILLVFWLSGLILFLILGGFGLWNYFISSTKSDNMYSDYHLLQLSTQRLDNVQRIVYKLTDYRLINIGLYEPKANMNLDSQDIRNTIDDLKKIQEELERNMDKGKIGSEQMDLLTKDVIPMQILEADQSITKEKVDLNQGIKKIIEKSFQLSKKAIETFNDQNSDLYYVEYALLNEFYQALVKSSQLYVESLTDFQQEGDSNSTFLISSIVVSLSSLFFILPVFSNINKNQEDVLKLFLEIPIPQIKLLLAKIEVFLNCIQIGDDEDLSEDELEIDNDDENEYHGKKSKRRKFKFESVEKRNFIIKFLIIIVLLDGYFVTTYILSDYIRENMKALVKEMNVTTQAQPFYTYTNNIMRKTYVDQDFPINTKEADETLDNILEEVYTINSQIHTEHSVNSDYHSDTYGDYFQRVMEVNACEEIVSLKVKTATQCNDFAFGILNEGMAPALTRLFENKRYLITMYQQFKANATKEYPGPTKDIFNDTSHNKIVNLLDYGKAHEINEMQDQYLRHLFKSIIEQFKESIEEELNSNTTTRITLFICFLFVLIFIFTAFWIPLVSKLSREIKRTSCVLGIIPLNIITTTPKIKEYITRQMKLE